MGRITKGALKYVGIAKVKTRHYYFCSLRRLALASCLFLAGCASSNISNWPESIPGQQVFLEAYLADESNQQLQSRSEYLGWTLSFYQGNLAYQSGWQELESVMLNAVEPQDERELRRQLGSLGAIIGGEWAKDNNVRRIDSRMLSLWGSALQLAENIEQQKKSIDVISQDVDDLLKGNLHKEEIVESRYTELLQLEFFGGF